MEYIKNRNLINQKFNLLTAIKPIGKSHPKEGRYWECLCDCGNKIEVSTQRLRSGATKHCGCSRNYNKDFTGKKINFLFVKEKISSGLYKCICECNKDILVRTKDLSQGRIRSCGCKTKQLKWMGYGQISGTFWARIKSNAKQRNIEFNIKIEDAWKVYEKQNGKCAITGLDIYFGESCKEHKNGLNTASLDRIDSSKPYIKNNIQWIHKTINKMKQDLKQSIFIEFCLRVSENYAKT